MRCDLCSRGSEAGPVLLIENPDPPAYERRKAGPRRQHQDCADAKRAYEVAEKARTDRWVDRQFAEFVARRIAVTA